MTHLFCFGLGYSARRFGLRLAARGWDVSGTSKSEDGARALCRDGFRGVVFDGQRASADVSQTLKSATHVLLSIPPDGDGDPAIRFHGADIAESPTIEWIGYLSTVGVYGDAAGGWVSEATMAAPVSERGKRRLDAEDAWRGLGERSGKTVMSFRLPGIYGPGRSAIDDVRAGTARRLIKPGQMFNRIHVDDIATALDAAIARPRAGAVYNVTDDEPAPPQDVVAYAAGLLGAPVPPDIDFETADITAMARSFYSESKRVSNALMKRDLAVRLTYPSYREGLAAIASATGAKLCGPGQGPGARATGAADFEGNASRPPPFRQNDG